LIRASRGGGSFKTASGIPIVKRTVIEKGKPGSRRDDDTDS
jgi:hypothetical protein